MKRVYRVDGDVGQGTHNGQASDGQAEEPYLFHRRFDSAGLGALVVVVALETPFGSFRETGIVHEPASAGFHRKPFGCPDAA
jgi:hypothetical protein